MWKLVVLALGLAADATAVAAIRGAHRHPGERWLLPALFGAMQAGMALLGHLVGRSIGSVVVRYQHWIVFVVFAGLGTKMIVDGIRQPPVQEATAKHQEAGLGIAVGLAVASSIDAMAAGLTLHTLPAAITVAVAAIGAITAVTALAGYLIGARLGAAFGRPVIIVGGVLLCGLGGAALL